MKQPSLKEVKEYFKNVKEVIPVGDTKKVNITKKIEEDIHEWNGHFWIDLDYSVYKGISVLLWDADSYEYAKILTYKEKTFSITESQINRLNRTSDQGGTEITIPILLKEWFPEAFESEVKLEVGKWYKYPDFPKFLTCLREDKTRFGIDVYGNWFDDGKLIKDEHQKAYKEATEQEVFEALKNQSVKRGYIENTFITSMVSNEVVNIDPEFYCEANNFDYNTYKNSFYVYGFMVFEKGEWAELVETITLSEAEQQLGKKIIV